MPEAWEIFFPWPDRALSPNSRGHWSKRSKAAKRYRHACRYYALQAIQAGGWDVAALRQVVERGGQIHLFIDFYPPDRRARDDDNVNAAFKAGRDGLADALGIDDHQFRTHPWLKRDEPVTGGRVRVAITTLIPAEPERND